RMAERVRERARARVALAAHPRTTVVAARPRPGRSAARRARVRPFVVRVADVVRVREVATDHVPRVRLARELPESCRGGHRPGGDLGHPPDERPPRKPSRLRDELFGFLDEIAHPHPPFTFA